MQNRTFLKILKYSLLIFSAGFYTMQICNAYECPGHPRSVEEIQDEDTKHRRNNDPARELGNDEQKEAYDEGVIDWAEYK